MIPFQLLDLIIPFYVVYNTNGIAYGSPNIIKISNLDNLSIELEKPFNAKLTFNILKELKEMVLFFNISNKTFKGQVLEYEEHFILIGTPLIHDPKDLENYKITLNDLPIHDSTADFLFAIESNKILLKETKESAFRLSESLAITKKLSENLAEEVEIKTEKYFKYILLYENKLNISKNLFKK